MRTLIDQFTINSYNTTTTLTQYEITPIIQKLALITGIIFCFIYFICYHYGQKKAISRIENNLQKDEYIKFKPKFGYFIDYIFSFGIGGFLGTFILPFFIYPNIQYIEPFNRSFLPLLIVAELIVMQFIFYFAFYTYVITNQRIIGIFAFSFIDNFINSSLGKFVISKNLKLININFSDISHLEIKKESSLFVFRIWLKDGTYERMPSFKNLDIIRLFIENQLIRKI